MYSDQYGLTGRPFQLTPDPRFYFESATHKKAMASLDYGLAQGGGIVIVTGEAGTGKTTLAGHLMETLDPDQVNAVRIVSNRGEGDDVLTMTAAAFGLPAESTGKAQLLDRIKTFAADRARTGQRTLLIIDEAQNLAATSLEELGMLADFQAGGKPAIQIFMLGQPELRERLNDPAQFEQLRQRVIATHHLTALTADEVRAYIRHRMSLVGWTGAPAFEESAFASVYRYSGGNPRKINNLMARALLTASLEGAVSIDGAMVDTALADPGSDDSANRPAAGPGTLKLVRNDVPAEAEAPDLAARVAALEAQVEEQGAVLHRILSLLVAWVEAEEDQQADGEIRRAPAG